MPDYVVNADSIGILENSLDRFWNNQACFFDYKANLIDRNFESKSIVIIHSFLLCLRSSLTSSDANIEAVACFRYSPFRFMSVDTSSS